MTYPILIPSAPFNSAAAAAIAAAATATIATHMLPFEMYTWLERWWLFHS